MIGARGFLLKREVVGWDGWGDEEGWSRVKEEKDEKEEEQVEGGGSG